jgi:hypothetical protein
MYAEDDRGAVHEASHALLQFLWTSEAGQVQLKADGRGSCTPLSYTYKRWNDSDAALALTGASIAVAGAVGEELLFGHADGHRSAVDRRHTREALEVLAAHAHGPPVTVRELEALAKHVLQRFRPAWVAAARMIGHGELTGSKQLSARIAIQSPELSAIADTPWLAGGQLWEVWSWLKRHAGIADHLVVVNNDPWCETPKAAGLPMETKSAGGRTGWWAGAPWRDADDYQRWLARGEGR